MTRTDAVRAHTPAGDATGPSSGEQPSGGGRGFLARVTRALMIITVVLNVVYLAALMLPGAPATELIDIWLSVSSQWLPTAIFWLVVVRTGFRRWEVTLAAAGMTFNVAAETYYVLAMDSSGYLASPSPADVGYLLYYPLTMAALVVLVQRQSRRVTGAAVFDGALAMLGASAVLALVLNPAFEDATEGVDLLDGAIAASYPLFDILLIAVIVGVSASPVLRIGPRWQFLVAGLLLFTGADIVYALLSHTDSYGAGTPLDAAWSIGVALSAVWVNGVDRVRPAAPVVASRSRILPVPAMAVLAGLAVLLMATQTQVPPVALTLAAAAIALSAVPVMFRQAALARLVEGQKQVVERLTELDKSKSDIIGTVSHEMRTPLTSIIGFLELALDDASLSEETKKMLRIAHRNARRLENMVGNMLVMSRLESGRATLASAPLPIGRVLTRAAESLRPFGDSRNVEIVVVCDSTLVIEGDEGQIERVFTNLMENSVKFSPAKGTVQVEVTLIAATTAQPESILISVADRGIGIPAEEVSHLFDRFFRATNARENSVPGTGLGLAIVREIVQAHQGDIAVTSDLGEGTTFNVTLPVQQAPRDA